VTQENSKTAEPEIPLAYNEDVEKYFDYFAVHGHVSLIIGDENNGEGFSDAEMAGYALSELILESNGTYEQSVGFPKEDFEAVTEKYFGAIIQNYNNRISFVIPETGNITPTGWSGASFDFVLKELQTDASGIHTGVFYEFAFGWEGPPPDKTELRRKFRDDLLRGFFDDYAQPSLITIVFEEKVDENGEMYLLYHDIKSDGEATPPYTVYQG
jgi:hypothetical protein